jgi:Xaa-Pro aminopeptidase
MHLETPFPREEYVARVARVQAEMARQGLDGLVLTAGPNLTYLSGYPSPVRAAARPFILVLPQAGDPILIVHTGRELEAQGYSWIADIRTYSRLSHAPLEEMTQALQDTGLQAGRVGAELGAEMSLDIPVEDFLHLQRLMPGVEFVDAGNVLWPVRYRKSEAEIAYIRRACEITTNAYASMFAQAREGLREVDMATAMAEATLAAGGSNPWSIITCGLGSYDLASKLPSSRRLEAGDFFWMDAGCAVGGYCSDFGRAGVVGGPTQEQRDAQARIHEITMLGVEMIRPGITTGDIARCCNAALARIDFPITTSISGLASRIGHGLGLVTTELPHVAEDDETVLEAGMVLTLEPGVGTTFGTFHVEENVVVTETGYEFLSHAPRELVTIPTC